MISQKQIDSDYCNRQLDRLTFANQMLEKIALERKKTKNNTSYRI